jgi:hypothetical protein
MHEVRESKVALVWAAFNHETGKVK